MKILHLGDLHIGKKVNDFCMLKEQKFVLEQAIDLIKKEQIEAVLISGDVFDKPIPQISALELFDEFLNQLVELKTKVFIISGNHDNMDRISYLSNLLKNSNIYISKPYEGKIEFIELKNNIRVYLMPYLYPSLVKKYYPNSQIKTYDDAIKTILDNIKLDNNYFNILLSHQFVIGSEENILSQSEQKSVGGIDQIHYNHYEKFDYTALGHLHCPQKCSLEKIRYCGSILKYSFSEINQKKKFNVLNIDKNKKLNLEFFDIKFLHEMKQYRGYIKEFLSSEFIEKIDVNDYIHFILEDEFVLDAKKKLSLIYPNIMLLEFDNSFTKNLNLIENIGNVKDKTIYEHFCDFYQKQLNLSLDKSKNDIVVEIINKELQCDH